MRSSESAYLFTYNYFWKFVSFSLVYTYTQIRICTTKYQNVKRKNSLANVIVLTRTKNLEITAAHNFFVTYIITM